MVHLPMQTILQLCAIKTMHIKHAKPKLKTS